MVYVVLTKLAQSKYLFLFNYSYNLISITVKFVGIPWAAVIVYNNTMYIFAYFTAIL